MSDEYSRFVLESLKLQGRERNSMLNSRETRQGLAPSKKNNKALLGAVFGNAPYTNLGYEERSWHSLFRQLKSIETGFLTIRLPAYTNRLVLLCVHLW